LVSSLKILTFQMSVLFIAFLTKFRTILLIRPSLTTEVVSPRESSKEKESISTSSQKRTTCLFLS
jgi:hypothetical protein